MHSLGIIPVQLAAPAKINLALHVVGRRADGYHLLDSLIAFAPEAFDLIGVAPGAAEGDSITVIGPFAASLTNTCDNILSRALGLSRSILSGHGADLPPVTVTLDKRLPVASGIGGGSADAAALLRWVAGAVPAARVDLMAAAIELGADVPMCCDGRPARVRGIGETVVPLASLPALPLLLVNPGVPVATPTVFKALTRRDNEPLPDLPAAGFADVASLAEWLGQTRNDLEGPAIGLVPEIEAIGAVLRATGALFARMSGSGATVFGLFASPAEAAAARRRLVYEQPGWWISSADPDDR